jgi:hypothetical protein
MSDRDLIVGLLKRAERRSRANRVLKNLAAAASISLLIPIAFKLLDLVFLFRGRTVVLVFTIWGIGSLAYLFWRIRGRETLADVAARLDRKAELHDQIKTAYWFIRHPQDSEWVAAQLRSAAHRTAAMDLNQLYPRFVPKSSYVAAGLALLLIGLNFAPLPWNHNWVYLDAAPAFAFTDAEQALLKEAQALLKKAAAQDKSQLADKVEEIAKELQQGDISVTDAINQLKEIEQELDEGNLDLASIDQGLEEIAQNLGQSQRLESVADSISQHKLQQAADQIRRAGDQLQMGSAEAKQMKAKLQEAAENPRPGLEELSKDLDDAADALNAGDEKAVQEALKKSAEEFEKLAQKMEGQQLKNQAGQRLQNVQASLEQRQGGSPSPGGQTKQAQTQSSGKPQQAGGNSSQQSSPSESADATESGAAGENDADNPQDGGGLMPGARVGTDAPLFGAPTKLDVELQQEQLTGQPDGAPTKEEKDEGESQQARSKLDYRNAPSDLSPAQKDLLNQDRLPWEYRQLIKQYFETIRTQPKK